MNSPIKSYSAFLRARRWMEGTNTPIYWLHSFQSPTCVGGGDRMQALMETIFCLFPFPLVCNIYWRVEGSCGIKMCSDFWHRNFILCLGVLPGAERPLDLADPMPLLPSNIHFAPFLGWRSNLDGRGHFKISIVTGRGQEERIQHPISSSEVTALLKTLEKGDLLFPVASGTYL